jgi:hypothetical protein
MKTYWVIVASILVAALALIGAPAHAEERPIDVPLSYIINLCNTGSPTAVGTAEVWQTEAEVKLTVQGLDPLRSGQIYALWLVNPQAGHFLPVGRFQVSAAGSALIDVSMQGSLDPAYSMVLVTVQPDPDPHRGVPSSNYVIAGFFPGSQAVQKQVKYLPDTGQYAQHPPFETTITPDNPPAPASTAQTTPRWLAYAPLLVALLSIAFVTRRTLRKGK